MAKHARETALHRSTLAPSAGKSVWIGAIAAISIAGFGLVNPSQESTSAQDSSDTEQASEQEATQTQTVTNEVADDVVVFPTVDFYNQICQPLSTTLTLPSTVSVATEGAVGLNGQPLKDHWVGQLTEISNNLRGAGDKITEVDKSNKDTDHPDLTLVADQARSTADQINAIKDGFAKSDSDERSAELAKEAGQVATDQGSLLTSSVKDIVAKAPLPSQATANEVYNLESCKSVFLTTPQLAEGEKIPAAEDFHTRLNEGVAKVNDTRSQLEDLAVTDDFETTKENVAKAWDARSAAAREAAELIGKWSMPDQATSAQAEALKKYVAARDDAKGVWTAMADDAQHQAEAIRATKDVKSLDAALDAASNEAWKKDIDEEKMIIRTQRNASEGI